MSVIQMVSRPITLSANTVESQPRPEPETYTVHARNVATSTKLLNDNEPWGQAGGRYMT
jgi:hypothetical protein